MRSGPSPPGARCNRTRRSRQDAVGAVASVSVSRLAFIRGREPCPRGVSSYLVPYATAPAPAAAPPSGAAGVLDAAGRVRAAGGGKLERTVAHAERVVVAGGGAAGGAAPGAAGVPGGSERGRGPSSVACRHGVRWSCERRRCERRRCERRYCERRHCERWGCTESCDGCACCRTVASGGCRARRERNGAAVRRRPLSVSRSSKPSLLNRHRGCSGAASGACATACGGPRSVGSFSKGENLVETSSRETTVVRLPFCAASVVADAASFPDGVLRPRSWKVHAPTPGSHHDRTTRVQRTQTQLAAGAEARRSSSKLSAEGVSSGALRVLAVQIIGATAFRTRAGVRGSG